MIWYLCGPVQFVEDDSYITWRDELTKWLEKRGHAVLDPTKKNQELSPQEINELIGSGNIDKVRDVIRDIVIEPDIRLVQEADGIIAYLDRRDTAGSITEIFLAYEENKPVLVVYTIPRKKWFGWVIGMSTKIFTSFTDLKDYIEDHYYKK